MPTLFVPSNTGLYGSSRFTPVTFWMPQGDRGAAEGPVSWHTIGVYGVAGRCNLRRGAAGPCKMTEPSAQRAYHDPDA